VNGISATPAITNTGAVASAALASNTPHWNSVAAIGRASTTYATAIGASTAIDIRAPLDRSSTIAPYRRSAAAALSRGINAMMIDTPTIPCAIIISRNTLLKINSPASASASALLMSASTTSTLIWLTPT